LVDTAVFDRTALGPGGAIEGPALVEEAHTTTVVLPGDRLVVDDQLALVIEVGDDDGA
jgi:N-methylhydantoinase A